MAKTSGDTSSVEIDSDLFTLYKSVNTNQSVGSNYSYSYVIDAKEDLADVVVTDTVPTGLEYVSSMPSASKSGSDLTWNIGDMTAGQSKTVNLTVKALQTGTFANCVSVTALPKACLAVVVGEPLLAIEKSVEDSTLLSGESAIFNIVVTNTGTSLAEDVVISDSLPTGLNATSALSFPVGDLAPSESKAVQVTALTTKSGEFVNTACASGSNVGEVCDDAVVYVNTPGLNIVKTGTDEQYIGKKAKYMIEVTNTGDIALTDLVVTDTVGQGMTIASAPGAVGSGNTVSWDIPSLAAGASKSFTVTTNAATAGTFCNSASVVDADMGLEDTDSACTDWKGFPALLLEVIDTTDPLLIGQGSTYVIQVTNQGNAPDYNISISADIAKELEIVSVSGATAGSVNGQKVSFASYPTIAPKQVIEFVIEVKGSQFGGGRSNFELDSKLLNGSIGETESTHVY